MTKNLTTYIYKNVYHNNMKTYKCKLQKLGLKKNILRALFIPTYSGHTVLYESDINVLKNEN